MKILPEIPKLHVLSCGEIWNKVALGGINPDKLHCLNCGAIWYGHYGGSEEIIITGNVKRILKVDWPYVKTIINVEG